MSLSNKELLDKCKRQFIELEFTYDEQLQFVELVAERYASEKAKGLFTRSEVESCIKDSLEAAAENSMFHLVNCHWPLGFRGKAYTSSESSISIDKSSITDTKNIKIK